MAVKKRVLYILANASRGGAEKITLLMMRYHSPARYEPVAMYLNRGPLESETAAAGIQTLKLATALRLSRPWQLGQATSAISKVIDQERIDCVHSCMAYPHIVAAPAAAWRGIPSILFAHGPVGGTLDRVASLLPTTMVIANSGYTAKNVEKVAIRWQAIRVLHLATDEGLALDSMSGKRAAIDRAYGFDPSTIVVGLLARLDPTKGVAFALEAMAPVLRANPQVKMLVVGGKFGAFHAGIDEQLRQIVEAAGVGKSVVFAGFQTDVAPFLARFDVFLNPSFDEGFGLSIIESMAWGKAVLASRVGGVPEVIDDGDNGVLFAAGDAGDLQRHVSALIADAAWRERLGAAGRRTVERRFRPEKMMELLESYYDQIV